MPALMATDIADITNATLNDLGRLKIQQIAQDFVHYVAFATMFKKERTEIDGGVQIQRSLFHTVPDNASHVGLYHTDVLNVENLTSILQVPWRYATTNWSFDEREFMHNRGKALIFNVIVPRREGAKLDLVQKIERALWQAPAVADVTKPYGIPYWVVKNATEGFTGNLPSDHTTIANINTATTPNFKNWSDTYVDVTKPDLIKSMRKGHRKTNFVSPIQVNEYTIGAAGQYKYYCNETTYASFEDVGESQNENLGKDVAPMGSSDISKMLGGVLTFRRHPIVYVPHLDDDADNPVFGIDHAKFKVVMQAGWNMKESPVLRSPTQHNVYSQHVDLGYNTLCFDRRCQQVFYIN